MCRHAETFYTNKDCKLIIVVFIPTLPFPKYKFVVYFSNVIWTKTSPAHPYPLHENELF